MEGEDCGTPGPHLPVLPFANHVTLEAPGNCAPVSLSTKQGKVELYDFQGLL
jgi:hypothetical protein